MDVQGTELRLETVKGPNVINQYHSKELDPFSIAFMNIYDKPIKHKFYELVDKDNNIIHVVSCDKEAIAQAMAARTGLRYRCVEFEERFEDLDKE